MRRAPTSARVLATTLLTLLLGPLVVVPAAAAEAVVETALMIDGTPEPDGQPVKLDVTILSTDPTTPRPGIVLAHGFNGTKDDSLEPARTWPRTVTR
jgi:ABC-2 type transport system ATP-binding protein